MKQCRPVTRKRSPFFWFDTKRIIFRKIMMMFRRRIRITEDVELKKICAVMGDGSVFVNPDAKTDELREALEGALKYIYRSEKGKRNG